MEQLKEETHTKTDRQHAGKAFECQMLGLGFRV